VFDVIESRTSLFELEFHECIDEIYELIQKYGNKILIGGDLNEDLNDASDSKRNNYLREFINDGQLKFNNTSKIFPNANGKECLEINYFVFELIYICLDHG
jgi:hypothetical protein